MTPAYRLTNIQFAYDEILALAIPELTIDAAKVTALVGPNGCGKSTLLNLLAFLQPNQQGQIIFFSEPITKKNTTSAIKKIAFLPQKPYMLSGTVADNLKLGLKFHQIKESRPERLQAALAKLNIAHLSQQQANKLSAGEQQKVAMARAIITHPDVLIMDEPFSCLDDKSEQALETFIRMYINSGDNKTLIFSTHNRLQGLAIADNVISLVKGELVKSPLINLFHGTANKQLFDTGEIQISLAVEVLGCQHISIDPTEIILSREPFVANLCNQFQGKVTAISDEMGRIRVTVRSGELFQVLISYQEFQKLDICLAEQLWINFNSNSILAL